MTLSDLQQLLSKLIQHWESELVEFKEARKDFDTKKIGQYFSALSNEANLRGVEQAWLVFGVNDKTRVVTGSDYRLDTERLQSIKQQIADMMQPGITFRNVYTFEHKTGGRVVLFEIPAAPAGMPISCNGHYYARSGESLTSLSLDKQDDIRRQTNQIDWSAQVVTTATVDDLDANALTIARKSFAIKHANRWLESEIQSWSDTDFLNRARLMRDGKITKAALLLLGKVESTHKLLPHPVQVTWSLKGRETAYEHFTAPFLISTTALYQRIRNIQMRILPENELLPIEVSKYDQKIILEALHNCIAHQDYTRNARIIVTEWPDKITFENAGHFYEGQPEDYIEGHKTPSRYRNTFLTQAMAQLNMIDTMGYGIHQMHMGQAKRYLPLPDYEHLSNSSVRLTIYGSVTDPAYSTLLIQKTDLPLSDILALDRVQKKLPIPDDMIKHLRRDKLIEGRKPNLRISSQVAKMTSSEATYIKNRSLDDSYYMDMILDYLSKFESASRQEIDEFLLPKLSDILDNKQKYKKISNLLTRMRRAKLILNVGSKTKSQWKLQKEK